MKNDRLKHSLQNISMYKAPADVWNNIESELPVDIKPEPRPYYSRAGTYIAGLSILMVFLVLTWYYFDSADTTNKADFVGKSESLVESQSNTNDLVPSAPAPPVSKKYENRQQLNYKQPESISAFLNKNERSSNKNHSTADSKKANINSESETERHRTRFLVLPLSKKKLRLTNYLDFPVFETKQIQFQDKKPQGHVRFSLGLNYQFERTVYENSDQSVLNFDISSGGISAGFQLKRFDIHVGMLMGFSSDKGKSFNTYFTYEKVDEFIYVDSVHIDPISYERSFFTSTVDVFDSVERMDILPLENQYRYLQFPVRIYYNIFSKSRFFMDVTFGGTFYQQTSMSQRLPEIKVESSQAVQHIPVRRKSNFSFSLGVRLGCRFGTNWSVLFRPELHRNLNSWYVGKDIKTAAFLPYRLGFGVNYRF